MSPEQATPHPLSLRPAGRVGSARWFFERGYELHRAGQLDNAVRCYQKSLKLHPTAEAHTFLGWIYSMQGRYEEAIRHCEQAITVDPEFGNPYLNLGRVYERLGKWHEAMAACEHALRLNPDYPGVLQALNRLRALVN